MFDALIGWLGSAFKALTGWILDAIVRGFKKIMEMLLDALAAVLEAIPVPDFMANAQGFFQGIPPGVVYVMDFFAIGPGISMIISALILRFIVRRIPFIG